eukprot:2478762-Pyramimonas_sp.AAC.1
MIFGFSSARAAISSRRPKGTLNDGPTNTLDGPKNGPTGPPVGPEHEIHSTSRQANLDIGQDPWGKHASGSTMRQP